MKYFCQWPSQLQALSLSFLTFALQPTVVYQSMPKHCCRIRTSAHKKSHIFKKITTFTQSLWFFPSLDFGSVIVCSAGRLKYKQVIVWSTYRWVKGLVSAGAQVETCWRICIQGRPSPLPQWTHHQSPKHSSPNMNFEVIGIKTNNSMKHLQWVFSPNLTVQTTNQSNTLWQTWWLWISSSSKCLLCFWDNFKMQLWDTTLANMVTLNFDAAPIAPNVFVD